MQRKAKNTASSSRKSHLEVEVKLKVHGVRTLRNRLAALRCEVKVPRSLEDNWIFDFPDLKLRKRRQLLRVRQFAGQCSLTLKGPAALSEHFKIREELETEVRDANLLRSIFERLGMSIAFQYQKFRTSYSLRVSERRPPVNISLDQTPIGNYLEIEGSEADIEQVALRLGYRKEDFINDSYLGLFSKSHLARRQRNMVFSQLA
jgi:adenylate cyclase, class 2